MSTLLSSSRKALGIIFIWYGALKLFPGVSPAETLAVMTIDALFFSAIPPGLSIKLLALWEIAVGLGLLSGYYLRSALALFFVHMFCTFTPLVLLPELCFSQPPFAFTLVGQYIVKNVLFILVGVMIYRDRFPSPSTADAS